MTGREKDILRLVGRVIGASPFARAVLQPGGAADDARAIDVQMTRLRQKIETDPANPKYLQTVRGQGYCLFAEIDMMPDDHRRCILALIAGLNVMRLPGFIAAPC